MAIACGNPNVKPRPNPQLEFWIAKDPAEALQKLADKTGAPVAAQIRIAIDEYLGKRKRK